MSNRTLFIVGEADLATLSGICWRTRVTNLIKGNQRQPRGPMGQNFQNRNTNTNTYKYNCSGQLRHLVRYN